MAILLPLGVAGLLARVFACGEKTDDSATFALLLAVTGLPTVLGWGGHESQWGRDGGEIARRAIDAETIYRATDSSRVPELIRKYGIAYVYVGPFERTKYGLTTANLRALDRLMDRVYDQDGVTIYRTKEAESVVGR